ncbi:hypothetical protein BKN38_03785 [Helicobacter sp. CLO-3]|uniref:hypothetical protein n=1 Tax=unclassified Helicobacter TaxID=2593540 RepID=UPI0008048B93|nr:MULTISPECIES: hypothetical protein [unclassified Helicobacter]OBV29374.1 hypothetical protein BA723_05680 [Helicobacter sp. CLO-3]OHU84155.1 hypothetical protein BKN38_03785 [Helicobacter sp. CLO-3]
MRYIKIYDYLRAAAAWLDSRGADSHKAGSCKADFCRADSCGVDFYDVDSSTESKTPEFKIHALAFALLCALLIQAIQAPILHASTSPKNATFPQVECDNPKRFTKAQRDHLVYAYNFGAPHGMGYTMAAIAWQESCAGEYMMNFSDPSAGLYHAHIPMVLKYYSSYKDTPFTRNVMGQLLINDRKLASQIALDNLIYWHKHHKGNYKNIIKSYNKGFKWQGDNASNALAESYYQSISKKVRALESYIPKYSRVRNQSTFIEVADKNKQVEQTFRALQDSKVNDSKVNKSTSSSSANANKATPQTQKNPQKSAPKSTQSPAPNAKQPPKSTPKPTPKAPQETYKDMLKPDDFVELPLEDMSAKRPRSNNFDSSFEDFNLMFNR